MADATDQVEQAGGVRRTEQLAATYARMVLARGAPSLLTLARTWGRYARKAVTAIKQLVRSLHDGLCCYVCADAADLLQEPSEPRAALISLTQKVRTQ